MSVCASCGKRAPEDPMGEGWIWILGRRGSMSYQVLVCSDDSPPLKITRIEQQQLIEC